MENTKQQKISTPMAIVVAGALIMIAILLTNNNGNNTGKEKTLSEQVGVNRDKFTQCLEEINLEELSVRTNESAQKAMKAIPSNEKGTPYAVIIGKNGSKAEVRGAYPKEEMLKLIAEVSEGKVTTAYTGEIPDYQEGEHILGNSNAPIVVIEYSDLECPYCKKFGDTMKEIMVESNGNVAWVYRHWIVHPNALPKAAASECVAKLKGNEAFWKYIDLVFGLMEKENNPIENL